MKVVELLRIGRELLKTMSLNDVMRDDWKYVSLFEQYQSMRDNGLKHHAAITILSQDYGISTRTVERIISRLRSEC